MIASLPMYDLPEVRASTDALWSGLARHLRAEGLRDVPPLLVRDDDHEAAWRDPRLLFSQSCGYPVTHAFAETLRIVATPAYAVTGCEGGRYHSVIVVREDARFESVGDLDSPVVAVNDHASHSGKNALYSLFAPRLREDDRLFAGVVVTGSHAASIHAVREERATLAAIDCVTHALLARRRPSALDGTRVLAKTASAPALPYVTRRQADDDIVERIRAALHAAMHDRSLAAARADLLLADVVVLPERDYDAIIEMERTYSQS